MGSRKWQESQPGPDWTDIRATMAALEAVHGVVVTICLGTGDPSGASFETHLLALGYGKDASVLGTPCMGLSGAWPCKDHKTLEACLYAGLIKLDDAISKGAYKQSEFPI